MVSPLFVRGQRFGQYLRAHVQFDRQAKRYTRINVSSLGAI